MPNFYHEKFNILESFKTTAHQDIYIATEKEIDSHAVVLNVVKDQELIHLMETEELASAMANLIHLERRGEELIIATRVLDAEPLLVYLEENYVPIKQRMDLAFQYLNAISKYDFLALPLKNILIDEAQLVVKDENLAVDELIVVEEGYNLAGSFNIGEKLSSVLSKIIFFEYRQLRQEELLLAEVQFFIEDLKAKPDISLKEALATFRKLYIYHYCMEGIDNNLTEEVPMKAYREIDEQPRPEKKTFRWPVVAAILLLLTVGAYGVSSLIKWLPERTLQGDEYTPVGGQVRAYFRIEEEPPYWILVNESSGSGEETIEAYLWEISYEGKVIQTSDNREPKLSFNQEGTYTISLKIMDQQNNGEWSEPHIEALEVKFDTEEDGREANITQNNEYFTLSTQGQNNIIKDVNLFNEGPYSFKLVNDQNLSPTFTLRNFYAREYETLSMLIKTSQEENLKLRLMVYNQGNLQHREEFSQSVTVQDDWKLVYLELPKVSMEEIKLEIVGFRNPIWVDSIELQPYK